MAGFPSKAKGNRLGESPVKQPHAGIALDKNVILELIKRYHGNLSKVAESMGTDRNVVMFSFQLRGQGHISCFSVCIIE